MWPIVTLIAGAVVTGLGYRMADRADLANLMPGILTIGAGVVVMFIGIVWALLS